MRWSEPQILSTPPQPAPVDLMEMCWAEPSFLAWLCTTAAYSNMFGPGAPGTEPPPVTAADVTAAVLSFISCNTQELPVFSSICCEAADVALMLTHRKF